MSAIPPGPHDPSAHRLAGIIGTKTRLGKELDISRLAHEVLASSTLQHKAIDLYRADHLGASGEIAKSTLEAYLTDAGGAKLHSLLEGLSTPELAKVKAIFNKVFFSSVMPAQVEAEAKALLDVLEDHPAQLARLKTILGCPAEEELSMAKVGLWLNDPLGRHAYNAFVESLLPAIPTFNKEMDLRRTQRFLKPGSSEPAALNLHKRAFTTGNLNPSFIKSALKRLSPVDTATRAVTSPNLQALSRAFNHPITRDSTGHTLASPRALATDPETTAWLIMGSNDLIQVELAYQKWKALPDDKKPAVLCFSGFGGHGTIAGPIFAHSEAESMHAYFRRLAHGDGLDKQFSAAVIIEETHSTNSGQNAEFVKDKLEAYNGEHAGKHLKHFVVFGVAPAITRQVLTVEQNFKQLGFPFETISGYPPDEAMVARTYLLDRQTHFPTDDARGTYHLCALREAATYFDYAISTSFMAPWAPSEAEVKQALEALNEAGAAFFSIKVKDRATPHIPDCAQFAKDFAHLMALKAKKRPLTQKDALDLTTLEAKLAPAIKPFSAYFRAAFAIVEETTMDMLAETSSKLPVATSTSGSQTARVGFFSAQKLGRFHAEMETLPEASSEVAQTARLGAFYGDVVKGAALGVSLSQQKAVVEMSVDWFLADPSRLPAGFPTEKAALYAYLLDDEAKVSNRRPRVELRPIPPAGTTVQIAIALVSGGVQRDEFVAHMAEKFGSLFSVAKAGSTTVELGQIGVNKSCPLNALSYPSVAEAMLKEMHYVPGALIDATKQGFLVADADGTLWDAPVTGEPALSKHLGNSPARGALFRYLLEGGVLVINSGNDISRIIAKINLGLEDLSAEQRKTILSRIAVTGMGGHGFVLLNHDSPITMRAFSAYSRVFQIPKAETALETSIGYIGDDAKEDGNDMAAFAQRGYDRCLCVAKSGAKVPEKLADRLLYGETEATARFLDAVMRFADEHRGAPLFSDFPGILRGL